MRRNTSYTAINTLSMGLALTASLLLGTYIADEYQYDRHHNHYQRLYRVVMDVQFGESDRSVAVTPAALAPTLASTETAIEQYALVRPLRGLTLLKPNRETIAVEGAVTATQNLFGLLHYRWLQGNPGTALAAPNQMVITEQLARQYFGTSDVLGQVVLRNDSMAYTVTGVLANQQGNSHLSSQVYASPTSDEYLTSWKDWNWCSYVRLRQGATPANLQPAFKRIDEEIMQPRVAQMGGGQFQFSMQPLPGIHFYSHRDFELAPNTGNITYLYAFAGVAALLLLIAAINYVNMSTARAMYRAKETGIRKAFGAPRAQLVRQYLVESFLQVGLAFIGAAILFTVLLPLFNQLTGKSVGFSNLLYGPLLVGVPLALVCFGLLAGAYPAIYLSHMQAAKVLQGQFLIQERLGRGLPLRKTLVALQLVMALLISIASLAVYQQLQYMTNTDLGFTSQQVFVLHLDHSNRPMYQPLKTALQQLPMVNSVGCTFDLPGSDPSINTFSVTTNGNRQNHIFKQVWVDHGYFDALAVGLVAGEPFYNRQQHDTAQAGIVINQSLATQLGWQPHEAVGKTFHSDEWTDRVVGVLADYHHLSLHHPVVPMVMRYTRSARYVLVRYAGPTKAALDAMANAYQKVMGQPMNDYRFLDRHFNQQYAKDQKRSLLFVLFSALAIAMAMAGLLGLAAFMANRRTKEVGIRKVLGATEGQIILKLAAGYVPLVLAAIVIAIPLVHYYVTEWLQQFAYPTPLHWWWYGAPSVVVALLALGVVAIRAQLAAKTNPTECLRNNS